MRKGVEEEVIDDTVESIKQQAGNGYENGQLNGWQYRIETHHGTQ